MKTICTYKGYQASIEYNNEDKVFVGHVLNIQDSISFDGYSLAETIVYFHHSIDDYLEMCEELGRAPNNPTNNTKDD